MGREWVRARALGRRGPPESAELHWDFLCMLILLQSIRARAVRASWLGSVFSNWLVPQGGHQGMIVFKLIAMFVDLGDKIIVAILAHAAASKVEPYQFACYRRLAFDA